MSIKLLLENWRHTSRYGSGMRWEEIAEQVELARGELELSQDQLWVAYSDHGGRVQRSAFINYLQGKSEPRVTDYALLAELLNGLLAKSGAKVRLPLLR